MGKRIQRLLLIPLLFISSLGYGSTYFSYVEDIVNSGSSHTYYYQFDYWKANSPTEPNPCVAVLGSAGSRNCYFTINHLHKAPNIGGAGSRKDWECAINFATYPTMASIIDAAQNQCGLSFPKKGETRHSGSITADECVGIFLDTNRTSSSAKMLPGGICGIAPPPAGKCYFNYVANNRLELDHGSLNAGDLNGNTQRGFFSIVCNQNMRVKVSSNMLQEYVPLRSNGELMSRVKLNDQPAWFGTIINARANTNELVTVESVLKTNGTVAPGNFSGVLTLVMTIP
ncbi:TPA: hypothetical protein ACS78A_002845 [Providencia alcalifaciens]